MSSDKKAEISFYKKLISMSDLIDTYALVIPATPEEASADLELKEAIRRRLIVAGFHNSECMLSALLGDDKAKEANKYIKRMAKEFS